MARVAINGFGRIGRGFVRLLEDRGIEDLELVAINEIGRASCRERVFPVV